MEDAARGWKDGYGDRRTFYGRPVLGVDVLRSPRVSTKRLLPTWIQTLLSRPCMPAEQGTATYADNPQVRVDDDTNGGAPGRVSFEIGVCPQILVRGQECPRERLLKGAGLVEREGGQTLVDGVACKARDRGAWTGELTRSGREESVPPCPS